MKALVYHGPGNKAWEEVPDPVIQQPTDVIVRIDTTTICGTDLHILGASPAVTDGRILGHEGVGTVTEVGSAVSTIAVGDRVIISCISACGACSYCHEGLYAHCLAEEGASGIGWIFGHLIDGTQAEFVRVPFADNSLYKLPPGSATTRPSCSRTSCPPASRSGSATATCSPGRRRRGGRRPGRPGSHDDLGSVRRRAGHRPGPRRQPPRAGARLRRHGRGQQRRPGLAREGAGDDRRLRRGRGDRGRRDRDLHRLHPDRWPGGSVANAGVHGKGVELALQDLWIMDLSITMGLVSTNTTPMLLKLVAQHRLPAEKFATHHFRLHEIMDAYETFGRAAETKALKVVMTR